MIALPARARILIVVLRRLGDVLLTTPLIRSVRRAWPDARIEVLAFADTTAILAGNPDVDHVIAMPVGPTAGDSLALAARIARRYDLAISAQGGDRPVLFAIAAGRRTAAPVGTATLMDRVKRALLTHGVPHEPGLHRVEEVLRVADALGVARVPEVVCPAGPARHDQRGGYAVIHPAPMFHYKRWTMGGWRTLADELARRQLKVVVTGGPAPAEKSYLDEIFGAAPNVERLDGALAWHEITSLIAGAQIFVGPDTSVTHLAAATGTPTVALYGPTDPRLWGPWPQRGLDRPWQAAGHMQQRGNVWLVQNPLPCLPCQQEGCERHLTSRSQCLDELSAGVVVRAVDQALQSRAAASDTRLNARN
jgi:heptosyltransferase-3